MYSVLCCILICILYCVHVPHVYHVCIYMIIPGTCLSSIFGLQPPKTRPKLQPKPGSSKGSRFSPLKINMEHISLEIWKIIFLSECLNL